MDSPVETPERNAQGEQSWTADLQAIGNTFLLFSATKFVVIC